MSSFPAPQITVCMPARNAGRTILRAITSVLASRHVARVVIRDDGSDDQTSEIVRAIDDRRVVLHPHRHSVGHGAAMNDALRYVDTELVARMDADDVSLPWRFSSQLLAFRDDDDFLFSPVFHFSDTGAWGRPQRLTPVSHRGAASRLLVENPFMHPTMIARTHALETLAGYRSVASEDYDLWLRAAGAGYSLRRTTIPVVAYRRHDAQLSRSASWSRARSASPDVEAAFDALARRELGWVPAWFSWRRAGFPRGAAPQGTDVDVERMLNHVHRLPIGDRIHLARRLRWIRARAEVSGPGPRPPLSSSSRATA
ncbi:glycosyltransferase family 2 protein [Curtobacterium pusillum]|uniref:glycosyltransferase family 2 protein n=1 Tax=Curtobacterium pusillum TaxID=69373 RepID=UPI0011A011E4|nr:glycosyltransferase [Curtobacterium pusillum]